jgi:hypothetical protein
MAAKNYSDLSNDELIRLLEARDRRDATRFGLVWEANEVERDRALNQDFVVPFGEWSNDEQRSFAKDFRHMAREIQCGTGITLEE